MWWGLDLGYINLHSNRWYFRITCWVYGSSETGQKKCHSPLCHTLCEDAGIHFCVMFKSNKWYPGNWKYDYHLSFADKFLTLTESCHESQARYHNNIFVGIPHNKCTVDLRCTGCLGFVTCGWNGKQTYHQSICQHNGSYLARLKDCLSGRCDKVKIGLGIFCINYKCSVGVDPYTRNFLRASASWS